MSQPQPSAQPGRDGPIKVLLAGFKVLLDVGDDVTVVGEAADGAEAVRLARATRPAVVLMDIRMPVLDGLEATRQIAATRGLEGVRVPILTTYDTDVYVFEALQAGASGFLLKDSGPAELLHAIRVVAAGEALLAPRITRRLIAQFTAARLGHRRRAGGLVVGVLSQQLLDQGAAAAAGDAGAAAAPDLLEVAGSGRDRLADLPVGDGPAVADVHRPRC